MDSARTPLVNRISKLVLALSIAHLSSWGSEITGRVVNSRQEAVPAASVTALDANGHELETVSNPDGGFHLQVPDGPATSDASGRLLESLPVRVGSRQTLPLELLASDTNPGLHPPLGSTVDAAQNAGKRVYFLVLDPSGHPISNAHLAMQSRSGTSLSASTACDGTFSLLIPNAGLYSVHAEASGFKEINEQFDLNASTYKITVHFEPALRTTKERAR